MANECKKYELATTNYVMGEEMPISKEELFEHLRNCPKCRADLVEWQDMYASWRTQGTLSQPQVKEKWDRFIKELTSQTPPPTTQVKASTDVKIEIDSAADKIYDYLKTNGNGEIPIPKLRQKTGLVDYPFYEAMSWLVMNDKATYTKGKDNRPVYACLRA